MNENVEVYNRREGGIPCTDVCCVHNIISVREELYIVFVLNIRCMFCL